LPERTCYLLRKTERKSALGSDEVPVDVIAVVLLWLVGIAAVGGIIALVITAFVQIAKTDALDNTGRAVWILIVIIAPVLGAAIWFWIGTRAPSFRSR
jgi:hypothetical protein